MMARQQKEECVHYIRPVRDVIDIISGRWKIPILVALSTEARKFKELERLLKGITARTLSKELKDLEANDLVERKVCDTSPITVEYSLSAYGRTLDDVIGTLRSWGLKHRERLFETKQADIPTFNCSEAVK